MSLHRGMGAEPLEPEPVGGLAGAEEIRRAERSTVFATGTLACPSCDAPVAVREAGLAPADALQCPFCAHEGAVRDFLTLGEPTRPTRVEVHVVLGRRTFARVRRAP
jgi:hypothetical protein